MGGATGSGRQWVSWIHHADLSGILLLALDSPDARGPINGMAPNPLTNAEFARALHRPAFLPTPASALRLMLGEVAELALTGQRVLPQRALALGYAFRFPTPAEALADVLPCERPVPGGS
jgi:NAD dependent epimerase/dehydratase family enzyme